MVDESNDITLFLKEGEIYFESRVGSSANHIEASLPVVSSLNDVDYYEAPPFFIGVYKGEILSVEVEIKINAIVIGSNSRLIRRGSSLSKIVNLLNEANVKWAFDQRYTFNEQLCLRTAGDVSLLFGINKKGGIVISKIISHALSQSSHDLPCKQ